LQSLFQECRKVGPSPFHECSKAGGTEAQDFGDHGPHSERILTTGDQCDQELLGRQRPHRLRFDPGVDLFLKFVDHAACRPASLRGVKALHEIRMARGLADDIRHEIRVARQRGVIRIDELLDLAPEWEVGRHHLDDPWSEGSGDPQPDRSSEIGLRSEVVVQERLVHASVIGDLLHACAVDAVPDEDLIGGVENAALGVCLDLARRFNHMVRIANSVPLAARFPEVCRGFVDRPLAVAGRQELKRRSSAMSSGAPVLSSVS